MNHSTQLAHASRFQLADFAPLISLATLLLFFSFVANDFVSFRTVSLVLKQGAVMAIVASGLTFVLLCAEIDLSVGMVALLSACLCGVIWEMPFAAGPKEANGAANVSTLTTALIIVVPLIVAVVLGLASGWLTISSGLPSFIIGSSGNRVGENGRFYVICRRVFESA